MIGFVENSLPDAGLPFPDVWPAEDVLGIVLLVLGGSGSTWSGFIPATSFKVSVLAVDGFNLIPGLFLRASPLVWDTFGVTAEMLVFVSA